MTQLGAREREMAELGVWIAVFSATYLDLASETGGAREALETADEAIDRMRTALAIRRKKEPSR